MSFFGLSDANRKKAREAVNAAEARRRVATTTALVDLLGRDPTLDELVLILRAASQGEHVRVANRATAGLKVLDELAGWLEGS